jgi:hypothetical protein
MSVALSGEESEMLGNHHIENH